MTVGRIGFSYNPTSEQAVELRERAEGWCRMRGLEQWAAPSGDLDTPRRELPTTDVLVVLGGDGTFLRAAQAVAEIDVPLLGVNLGKVGFLSKAEANELDLAADKTTVGIGEERPDTPRDPRGVGAAIGDEEKREDCQLSGPR